MMMQHPMEDDDIREIKRPILKAPQLASPTTPFHFEEARPSKYYVQEQQFDERIQRTIQLQLLNYMDNFGGIQQQHGYSRMNHGFLQPPTAAEHSTIALLQQRFLRLERDKEMRQAKQLNHGSYPRMESSLLEDSSSPSKSSFHKENVMSHRPFNTSPPAFTSCNKDVTMFDSDLSSMVHSKKAFENNCFEFLSTENPHGASTLAPVYHEPRETQFLLKNWRNTVERADSVIAGHDDHSELDTSLHL